MEEEFVEKKKKRVIGIRLCKSFLGKIGSSFLLFKALTDGLAIIRQYMLDTVICG